MADQPDLSQRKIAQATGETYPLVRYHMNAMAESGILRKEIIGHKANWTILIELK